MLLPPVTTGEAFHELRIDDQKTIHFHALIPLHADEMDLKLGKGAEALFEGFEKHGVSEILHATRPSIISKKERPLRFLEERVKTYFTGTIDALSFLGKSSGIGTVTFSPAAY
ncbi:MAG: hypothetical protein ACI8T1_002003 [Verrucomicrobiales bacterium]|jgi:hypothetical protein